MDTLGELGVVVGVGVLCLLLGHHIGKCAGWSEGWDKGYESGSGEWYSEDEGGLVDHYRESEN